MSGDDTELPNGNQIAGVTTDFDGNYTIKPLDPGTYDLIVSFVGYGQVTLEGIVVSSNKITFRDVQLSEGIDIEDPSDPVEVGIVARSFDSCLVCTVHAHDQQSGVELSRFKL